MREEDQTEGTGNWNGELSPYTNELHLEHVNYMQKSTVQTLNLYLSPKENTNHGPGPHPN